jgi:hypothetical protein
MPTILPGQAKYVIDRLLAARRITARDITGYLGDLQRNIVEIEERLARLRAAQGGNDAASVRATPRRERAAQRSTSAPQPAKRRKRRFTVTAKVLASRALQGRYLPLLNKFSGAKRVQYAKLAKDKGREAAIKEMEAALKR